MSDYATLMHVALQKNCSEHKARVEMNMGGVTLIHGDHRRRVSMLSVDSESGLIAALRDFIEVCHAYDEDEDER